MKHRRRRNGFANRSWRRVQGRPQRDGFGNGIPRCDHRSVPTGSVGPARAKPSGSFRAGEADELKDDMRNQITFHTGRLADLVKQVGKGFKLLHHLSRIHAGPSLSPTSVITAYFPSIILLLSSHARRTSTSALKRRSPFRGAAGRGGEPCGNGSTADLGDSRLA
jgi:hypothetical protein